MTTVSSASSASSASAVDTDVLSWLLASPEPAVAHLARRDLLHQPEPEAAKEAAKPDRAGVLDGPMVRGLLRGQQPDGGFGVRPYSKWTGAHWRLISLVELGVPAGEPRAVAAAVSVLDRFCDPRHRGPVVVVDGLPRVCASIEANLLAVCCRLGVDDDRVHELAESLMDWQWPDGGWNCDRGADGHRSSFYESLGPMWGLWEYHLRTGDPAAREAAERAAELFLDHGLFRARTTGAVIDRRWLAPRWPPYWHYDILQALLILSRLGRAGDPRADEAKTVLRGRRRANGRWRAAARWWRPPGSPGRSGLEAVDWGRVVPDQMVTLNALRVLQDSSSC